MPRSPSPARRTKASPPVRPGVARTFAIVQHDLGQPSPSHGPFCWSSHGADGVAETAEEVSARGEAQHESPGASEMDSA